MKPLPVHPRPVLDCVERAEVYAIYDHATMRRLLSLKASEQREFLNDRIARARSYAEWRVEAYERGECGAPW